MMEKPPLDPKDPIHRLPIHADPFPEAKQGPDPPVAEGRMSLDQPANPCHQELVETLEANIGNRIVDAGQLATYSGYLYVEKLPEHDRVVAKVIQYEQLE